jgi:hypothetical protein
MVATDVRLAGRRARDPVVTARTASITVGYAVKALSPVVTANTRPARSSVGAVRVTVPVAPWLLVILALLVRTRCLVAPRSWSVARLVALSASGRTGTGWAW